MLGVGHGLFLEAWMELAQDQVHHPGNHHQGNHARKKMPLAKQDEVADPAHGAETAPLGQNSDEHSGSQGNQQWSLGGSRPLKAVEKYSA